MPGGVAMTTGDTDATVDQIFADSLVQRAMAAFNAHDADGFVALMAETSSSNTAPPRHLCMDAMRQLRFTQTCGRAFPI
jgi:hypothetical protein